MTQPMPIDYKEYHPDWKAISLRIRNERAGNKCEWCRVDNHAVIMYPVGHRGNWFYAMGLKEEDDAVKAGTHKRTKVVLTVAHIDHDKTNNDESNLAALCQACHLSHDRKHHENNRKYGRNWKENQGSLFPTPPDTP